jgi:multimeric flavodoxin WrbA
MKILSICGSPRKGNSETILLKLKELFQKKHIENDIVLLREKNIQLCGGCVEYCNHQLKCHHRDDFDNLIEKIEAADGFVFITPNYFQMPPAIFVNFIDRCSIFYTRGANKIFSKKISAVICVGTDSVERIEACTDAIADRFCKTIGLPVAVKKSFRSNSELKGNYNDIFENGKNSRIQEDLQEVVDKLVT